jgi:hypothetical protein
MADDLNLNTIQALLLTFNFELLTCSVGDYGKGLKHEK